MTGNFAGEFHVIFGDKKTKTEGATKAGSGKYCFPMKELNVVPAGTGYSTSKGGVIEGERMLVGYINKAKGTGSRPHSHPNEQFNYILQGTLDVEIDGQVYSYGNYWSILDDDRFD